MSADILNKAVADVLKQYPPTLASGLPTPLGNRGGFSGARLWRIDSLIAPLCLRAWPAGFPPARLHFIHECMNQAAAARLPFTPRVFPTDNGATWVERAHRLWELQEWLPGEADYHRRPSPAKLQAACAALARLHVCWQAASRPATGPCPAVARRLEIVRQWRELVQSGWQPPTQAVGTDAARAAAERAWRSLPARIELIPDRLSRWIARSWPLQPCLCDVWHDHVLFDGGRLTGLVDYGAMKIDHPAVDLARLLGSLVEDDLDGWRTGLAAYREVRPFSAEEEELARALDRSGVIAGAAVWLRWLYHDRKDFENRAAAGRRLKALTDRMDGWQ